MALSCGGKIITHHLHHDILQHPLRRRRNVFATMPFDGLLKKGVAL